MASLTVPIGAKAPYGFRVLLSNDPDDLAPVNYTQVTACVLEVSRFGEVLAWWPTVMSAQTTGTATATRTCSADGSDFVGVDLSVRALLTIPGGERFCESFLIEPKR